MTETNALTDESGTGTKWPSGDYNMPNEDLWYMLRWSAVHHAQLAISLFVSENRNDVLQAATSVGCAVELLAKTLIAKIEPTLLADKGDRDSVLILSNKGHLATCNPTQLKSISATDALKLIKHLHPALTFNPVTDQHVLLVRNAAIHMALADKAQLRRAVVVMCRFVEDMLPLLEIERTDFWDTGNLDLVNELLDDAQDEIKRVVAAKLVAARTRLERLVKGLDETGSRLVLAALADRQTTFGDYEKRVECPVCEQDGWLICVVFRGDLESDLQEDGRLLYWVEQTAYPIAFQCSACGLDLQTHELGDFGFPEEIELEPDFEPPEAEPV